MRCLGDPGRGLLARCGRRRCGPVGASTQVTEPGVRALVVCCKNRREGGGGLGATVNRGPWGSACGWCAAHPSLTGSERGNLGAVPAGSCSTNGCCATGEAAFDTRIRVLLAHQRQSRPLPRANMQPIALHCMHRLRAGAALQQHHRSCPQCVDVSERGTALFVLTGARRPCRSRGRMDPFQSAISGTGFC